MQNHKHGFDEALAHHHKGDHAAAFAKVQSMIEADIAGGHEDGMAEAAKPGATPEMIVKATLRRVQAGHDEWVKMPRG